MFFTFGHNLILHGYGAGGKVGERLWKGGGQLNFNIFYQCKEVLVTNIFFEKCQNFKVNEIASTRTFLKRFDYFNFEILRFDH